jgi:HlyD family secretion protein
VEPQATLEVKLENDRTVKTCYVKEGDEVKEGQRLFTYDTQDDEDKLAQAEIDIEKAQGDIEVSEKTIEQLEKEKASASADDQLSYTTQILSEQNEIKQNEYAIKSNELEISQLQETIENATVTAEMAGIVQSISDSSDSDSSYSYSSGSDSAYITILALGDYRIKGTVNEQNYQLLYDGMEMIVYSRVDSSLKWYGTISEIKDSADDDSSSDSYYYYSSSSDSGSSNYTFYVELESSEGLMLGQHVYMEQNSGQDDVKDGLWLEEYYIMEEDGQSYVWVANESNVIEKREVALGEFDEDLYQYEILSGLDADDYIAYPMDNVTEGAPVIYNDYSSVIDSTLDGDYAMDGLDYSLDADDSYFDDEDFDDEDFDDEDFDDEDFDDEEFDDEDFDDEEFDDEDFDDEDFDDEDFDDEDLDDADSDDEAVDEEP